MIVREQKEKASKRGKKEYDKKRIVKILVMEMIFRQEGLGSEAFKANKSKPILPFFSLLQSFSIFIATSKIAVPLDNSSKKWYNMSRGDEKNG